LEASLFSSFSLQFRINTVQRPTHGPACPSLHIVSPQELLARTLTLLEPALRRLGTEGFSPFESAYYLAWLHSGQRVEVNVEEEGQRVPVIVEGLSPHGYLLARGEAGGETFELHPDGNSLDFFKGLIRKKLPV
jgi:biotin---protein ligase